MCGIAGFVSRNSLNESDMLKIAEDISKRLEHRGPNDKGSWVDQKENIGLCHRRLAILDLSPMGHQPMVSPCGRYVMVFNGEIYNHSVLRVELGTNVQWKGYSDTETLLACISIWGLKKTLKKSIGMFAIALWDRKDKCLSLSRDRMGEKPLYYGFNKGNFVFASELKAICAYPSFSAELSSESLSLFLKHNSVPAPYSIYKGIFKLIPGCILKLSKSDLLSSILPNPQAYWALSQVAEAGQRDQFIGSDNDAINEVERLLKQSISDQLIADVPLGAFLSGGIDSSTVVALMQTQCQLPVQTFTIGFLEDEYNEANYARKVATYIGTQHNELYISSHEAMDVIPLLQNIYDEPFADPSQIPTYLVSRLASQNVSISLSGDGGDELFGGYNRHKWIPLIWRRIQWLPHNCRCAIAGVITNLPPSSWNEIFRKFEAFLPNGWRYSNPGDKLHKLADVIVAKSADEIYEYLISQWKNPNVLLKSEVFTRNLHVANHEFSLEHRMMYLDSVCYLPDDVLAKVDRAAMAVSLETRVPFLDHRLIEFSWRLPLNMKIRNGEGKWLIKQLLRKHIPAKLVDRPKMGFGVPIDSWLRGSLKSWAEELLDPLRMEKEGYLKTEAVQKVWIDHQMNKRNCSYQLWNVLMFQTWLDAQKRELNSFMKIT